MSEWIFQFGLEDWRSNPSESRGMNNLGHRIEWSQKDSADDEAWRLSVYTFQMYLNRWENERIDEVIHLLREWNGVWEKKLQ